MVYMKNQEVLKEVSTSLGKKVEVAGKSIQYNETALNILKDKKVLAYILSNVVSEFAGYSMEDIINAIEDEPKVQTVPVEPGMLKRSGNTKVIHGVDGASYFPGEGVIYFDIVFTTLAGIKKTVKLYINIEAQKKFNPGYDIVTRGVVYGARLISEQMEVENISDNYDNVKKVYSIWLCFNCPSTVHDSITEYSISPKNIYGNYLKSSRYDIMSVIVICLSDDTLESENKLVGMLSNLFSPNLDFNTKKETLESKYDFRMTKRFEMEANNMCNLAEGIFEIAEKKGLEQGMKKGMEKGMEMGMAEERVRIITTMLQNGCTDEIILKGGFTLEEIDMVKQELN